MARTRLLLLFGGVSSEHEISLRSAASVLAAVDRDRYHPLLVGIHRDGTWRTGDIDAPLAEIVAHGPVVTDLRVLEPDLVFPVLHGPYGEDGTMAGLLEVLGLPYVGSGVLASALCMDKRAQKLLLQSAAPEIPLVPWRAVDARMLNAAGVAANLVPEIVEALGLPCFVKPANLGSSVGIEKVERPGDLLPALQRSSQFDPLLIVERGVDAREIEVAILGSGDGQTLVSDPGEILLPAGVWYDYDTKYTKDVARIELPAALDAAAAARIRKVALQAFRATGCHGLARIDFLVDRHNGTPYLNELNTMPGFTSISMYPKLMGKAGVEYPELIHRLCQLALERHAERRQLSTGR